MGLHMPRALGVPHPIATRWCIVASRSLIGWLSIDSIIILSLHVQSSFLCTVVSFLLVFLLNLFTAMAPMKAMKGSKNVVKAMPKGAIAAAIAEEHELKKGVCAKIIDSLASLAATEVKKTGKFVIPGVAMLKTRVKPATKAGKREVFGKEMMVKAKPAKTIVKAYPVAAIKKSI